MKLSNIQKSQQHNSLLLAVSIFGPIILFVVVIVIGFIPGDAKPITEIASQFKPDQSWRLNEKIIYPPRLACLEANCNTVHYQWQSSSEVTKEDLKSALSNSNFDFDISGDCLAESAASGSGSRVCSAKGLKKNYIVEVDITKSNNKPDISTVNLRIKK